MRLKNLTEEQRGEYLRQLRAGETNCAEVARQTGYTQRAVWYWAHEQGLDLHRTKLKSQKNNVAQKNQAVQMYLDGASLSEILSQTGVTNAALGILLGTRGIPRRALLRKSDEAKQRAVKLYMHGSTVKEASEETGVSEAYIAILVKRAGVLRGRLAWPNNWPNLAPPKSRPRPRKLRPSRPAPVKSLSKSKLAKALAYPSTVFTVSVTPEAPWHEKLLTLVQVAYRARGIPAHKAE